MQCVLSHRSNIDLWIDSRSVSCVASWAALRVTKPSANEASLESITVMFGGSPRADFA